MTGRRTTRRLAGGVLAASLLLAPACAGPRDEPASDPVSGPRPSCVERGTRGTLTCPASGPGSSPPPWLGTRELPRADTGFGVVRPTPRVLRTRRFTLPDTVRLPDAVPPLPGRGSWAGVIDPAPRHVIARSTWAPGCPVGRDELAWVRLTFWGFDARHHAGELLVHSDVASDVVDVFRRLHEERFPMERVLIVRTYDPDAPPTGDGNGTGGFVCRPTTGGTSYSEHAYGLAIDVNTFQNPYRSGEVVLPELASSYLDRTWVRPGMVVADGPVVDAFADVGWEWGGAWSSLKDYQHFSRNGL